MNRPLLSDSYKTSHWKQLPPGSEFLYSYWESRGGEYPYTVFFGLQYLLMKYFASPVLKNEVDYAEERITKHMGPGIFNRDG